MTSHCEVVSNMLQSFNFCSIILLIVFLCKCQKDILLYFYHNVYFSFSYAGDVWMQMFVFLQEMLPLIIIHTSLQ